MQSCCMSTAAESGQETNYSERAKQREDCLGARSSSGDEGFFRQQDNHTIDSFFLVHVLFWWNSQIQ